MQHQQHQQQAGGSGAGDSGGAAGSTPPLVLCLPQGPSQVYSATEQHLSSFMDQGPVVSTVSVLDGTAASLHNGVLGVLSDAGSLNNSGDAIRLEDVNKGLPGPRPLQPRLLKQINSLNTKEELLDYVARCHQLLDPINLVTCLYRLARIYSITQVSVQKAVWRAELFGNAAFTLLLSAINSHLMQAQAILSQVGGEVQGLNARCMSNLIWALIKLEVTAEDGHPLATDIVTAAGPLVVCFLSDCSGQGLANLLWSFAKIQSTPPVSVMTAIVKRMVELLQDPAAAAMLDVQALSNSIWAIAHVQSSNVVMESQEEWQEAVANFLLLMANQCLSLLHTVIEKPSLLRRTLLSGAEMDGKVSCQALANVVWSFASILGSACGLQDPVRPLFLLIRQLTIAKLGHSVVQGKAAWSHTLAGTFNETALANVVFAYDKAQLLDGALLQVVLDAAGQKLVRASSAAAGGQTQPLGFKAQELLILLSACQLGIAQPRAFVQTLNRVLKQYPAATSGWTLQEQAELHQLLSTLNSSITEQGNPAMLTQVQQQAVWSYPMQGSSNSTLAAHIQQPTISSLPNLGQTAGSLNGMVRSGTHSVVCSDVGSDANMATSARQSMPVQQVWLRSADGTLQPATLLLAPQQLTARQASQGSQQYTLQTSQGSQQYTIQTSQGSQQYTTLQTPQGTQQYATLQASPGSQQYSTLQPMQGSQQYTTFQTSQDGLTTSGPTANTMVTHPGMAILDSRQAQQQNHLF